MSKSKIEELCTFLNNNKAKTYPIENDMLVSEPDFIINGYLKMLGVILQRSSEMTDAQLSMFQRIIAGTDSEKSTEEYFRMALEIEIDDFLAFTSEIKELSVKYRFVLDAMILSCVSEKSEEQIQLIAEFSEALGIRKDELQYIATMAKAILCMDVSAYVDACEIEFHNIPQNVFYGYVKTLTKECILQNDNVTIFQPSCEEEVTVDRLSQISKVNTPIIKLSNVKINLSEYSLVFGNREKVIIDNCEFIGGEKYSIGFMNCKEIIVSNSSFCDFSVQTFYLRKINSMRISNSSFMGCCMEYDENCISWAPLGGVIYVADNTLDPIVIDGCTFSDCGGRNRHYSCRSAILVNHQCNVSNSTFRNCWHYYDSTEIDPDNKYRTMFFPRSKATRCTFDNSAAFC